MIIITAIINVYNDPDIASEILVYHSGDNVYTALSERMIGNPNKIAIGRPRNSLLRK